ncbi:MAG: Uma2 family endonuclease [Deltaproteobacteria bacterium]|nr:Uma2 family endonuclease [Deltaproteobacteria bacterium]
MKVSPDVYLLDDPPPPPMPRNWQTWRPGHRPPRWAVEVVSDNWSKDYEDGPAKYALLGCAELVLFDPDAVLGVVRNQARAPLSVFRRGADGALAAVYSGPGPAYSEQIGCWLWARREGYLARLRLSEDEEGQRMIPTRIEAEAARAREAEAARAREAEKRAEAEKRVRELEERLRRMERDR